MIRGDQKERKRVNDGEEVKLGMGAREGEERVH